MENIVVWLAEGKISNELLKSIVSSIIYDDEYSEELALHLINNIQS